MKKKITKIKNRMITNVRDHLCPVSTTAHRGYLGSPLYTATVMRGDANGNWSSSRPPILECVKGGGGRDREEERKQ